MEDESRAPAEPSRPLILVVEDHDAARMGLIEAFEGEGWVALGALHGAHALDVISAHGMPDVIVLDLHMPIMDGGSFLAAIRAQQGFERVRIVVLTGRLPAERDPSVAVVLEKPCDTPRLLSVVRSLL